MGNNWKRGCFFLSVAFLLTSVALIACLVHISLAPSHLQRCQEQLGNDTAALTGKLTALEGEKGTLEEQRDEARAEVRQLQLELDNTNRTLWETQEHGASCRSLTHALQDNLTALQDEIAQLGGRQQGGEPGEIDKLRQQLQEALQQRDKLQADVRQLEQQHQGLKNQSSAGISLRTPTPVGCLSLLALSLAEILLL